MESDQVDTTMTVAALTVGQLRKLIDNTPDDSIVSVVYDGMEEVIAHAAVYTDYESDPTGYGEGVLRAPGGLILAADHEGDRMLDFAGLDASTAHGESHALEPGNIA